MADASEKKDKKPSSNPESESLGGSSSSVSLSPITTGPRPHSISSLILLDLPECDEDDVRRSLEERAGPTGHVSRVTLTCNHPNPMTEESHRKYATATVTHTGAVDDVEIAVGLRKPTLCMFSEECQAVFNINQSLFTESVYNTVAQQAAKLRLAITFDAPGSRLEVAGSCNDVNKFRDYLSRLCVHNVLHMPELANGIVTPVAQPHPKDETAVADSSSSSNVVFSNLSPDVLLLLPKLRTIPGVRYYPGQGSVEFVSDNPEERERMISSFQEAYQRIVQNSQFKSGTLELPPSTQAESVITLLNQYNDKYHQCHFSYDPTSHSLKIVTLSSRQFDQAKKLLGTELSSAEISTSVRGPSIDSTVGLILSNDSFLTLKKGNIIEEKADVIVNAANSELKHCGGLALALDVASKGELQQHSDVYQRRNGKVATGNVAITSAGGKLLCQHVIHAVGPDAALCRSTTLCQQLIFDAVTNSLKQAQLLNATSIVLPALSTGVYGVKPDVSAEAMLNAITSFKCKKGTLTDIRIVILDNSTYNRFAERLAIWKATIACAGEVRKLERSLSDGEGHSPSTSSSNDYSGIITSQPAGAFTGISYPNIRSHSASVYSDPTSSIRSSTVLSATSSSGPFFKPSLFPSSSKILPSIPSISSEKKEPIATASDTTDTEPQCPICMSDIVKPTTTKCCKSLFCTECLNKASKASPYCPICRIPIKKLKGNQPPGKMDHYRIAEALPGYERHGTIVISYHFSNGTQGSLHPNPGKPYSGTSRTAYLPDNDEGRHVLKLLRKAFDAGLVFTVGTSATSGQPNTIVWNDVHHKTRKQGGSDKFGYPDRTYLKRVQEELKAKGIY